MYVYVYEYNIHIYTHDCIIELEEPVRITCWPSLSQVMVGCGLPRASHLHSSLIYSSYIRHIILMYSSYIPLLLRSFHFVFIFMFVFVFVYVFVFAIVNLRVAGRSRATRTSAGCSTSIGAELQPVGWFLII